MSQIDRNCVVHTHLFLLKEKRMTARVEVFQPGHLTWSALTLRRH